MKITQKEKLRILKLHESYRNWNGSLIKEEDKETTDPADDEEVDDVDSFYSLNAGTEEEEGERREREIDKLGGRFEVKRDSMLPPRIDGGRLDSENFHIGYLEPFEGGNILSDKFIKDFPNLSILHLADNREDLTQRTKNFPSPTFDDPHLDLIKLPENIGDLKNMHNLSFPDNPYLTKLPWSILDMDKLQTLNVVNTPIDMPPDFWEELENRGVRVYRVPDIPGQWRSNTDKGL